jgi:hypothetical protein
MLRLTVNHIHNHFGVSPYSRHVATTVTKRTKKYLKWDFLWISKGTELVYIKGKRIWQSTISSAIVLPS